MENRVISFHYTLTNKTGQNLDSSIGGEPLAFIVGMGGIIPGLESELVKLKVGDKKKIEVAAADAYGTREKERVVKVPKKELPKKNVKVGDQFQADQDGHMIALTVIAVGDLDVTLDGNHPLAGEDLTFDVEITDMREATAEEMSHGHVHGAGGHHH